MSSIAALPKRLRPPLVYGDPSTYAYIRDNLDAFSLWPGRNFYLDPANGSDNGDGSIDRPFATLPVAFDACTTAKNDRILLVGDGDTTATARLSATLVWNKKATHLIGITAPTGIAQRARVSTATGQTTNINPLVQVTAEGCMFQNFSLFQGVGQTGTAEQLWEITSHRGYYGNIHFGGIGHNTCGAEAASYVLKITAGRENTFERCTIGVDTAQRSAANASLLLRSGATRTTFLDCTFLMWATQTSPLFIDANAASSMDRFVRFVRCMFHNPLNISPLSTPTVVALGHANQNGTILFENCGANNVGAWAAANALTRVSGMVVPVAAGGISVNSA